MRFSKERKKILAALNNPIKRKVVERHLYHKTARRFADGIGDPRSQTLLNIRAALNELSLIEGLMNREVHVSHEAPALSTTEAPLISDDGPRGSGVLSRIQAGVGSCEDQLQKLVAVLPRLIRLCDEFGV